MNGQKKRISSNPQIAFSQGLKSGRSEGVQAGFQARLYLCLLGMYNANAELGVLTKPKFAKFYSLTEKEVGRIFTEEFANDPENIADIAIYHSNEIRKKLGLDREDK